MLRKILIANRGEIACRVIKTAQRLGIQCVAVYSEVDQHARHVQSADEAYYIGKAASQDSYLRADKILSIAQQSGADAIHPGYGFLSENAEFADACETAGIIFIGPSASAIRSMGSKSASKSIMQQANVPVTPGYHGDDQSEQGLLKQAEAIGYPVLLKASAGGGGKGMRVVNKPQAFSAALASAKREAKASFSDDRMLIEKYLSTPRHIEMQIFADQHGNAVHLFERDCSIQRRHQKVVEEAPAPHLSNDLREALGIAATNAAKAINYVGAGTVEFLVDSDENFYFMEMNTRLQVEHPVTEMISGQDLVEWQLRIANGETLPLTQEELCIKGHAIEVRIYAEDPQNDFLPAIGRIAHLTTPTETKHLRIDTGIVSGDDISPYYDPMIAKLIVWDTERSTAIQRLTQALAQYQLIGLKTNVDFLQQISQQTQFVDGCYHTHFIDDNIQRLITTDTDVDNDALALASVFCLLQQKTLRQQYQHNHFDPSSPWHATDAWQSHLPQQQTLHFVHQTQEIAVQVLHKDNAYCLSSGEQQWQISAELLDEHTVMAHTAVKKLSAQCVLFDQTLHVFHANKHSQFTLPDSENDQAEQSHDHQMLAPMPGLVIDVMTKTGDTVKRGDPLLIMEAMKMEHSITAPHDGVVRDVFYQIGDQVNEGAELIAFEE